MVSRAQHFAEISDFLNNRIPKGIVNGEASEPAPVTSGVHQGSALGLVLFLSYINDLPDQVSSRCCLFTDNIMLYREINTCEDCSILQTDLDTLVAWEKQRGMEYRSAAE